MTTVVEIPHHFSTVFTGDAVAGGDPRRALPALPEIAEGFIGKGCCFLMACRFCRKAVCYRYGNHHTLCVVVVNAVVR